MRNWGQLLELRHKRRRVGVHFPSPAPSPSKPCQPPLTTHPPFPLATAHYSHQVPLHYSNYLLTYYFFLTVCSLSGTLYKAPSLLKYGSLFCALYEYWRVNKTPGFFYRGRDGIIICFLSVCQVYPLEVILSLLLLYLTLFSVPIHLLLLFSLR